MTEILLWKHPEHRTGHMSATLLLARRPAREWDGAGRGGGGGETEAGRCCLDPFPEREGCLPPESPQACDLKEVQEVSHLYLGGGVRCRGHSGKRDRQCQELGQE